MAKNKKRSITPRASKASANAPKVVQKPAQLLQEVPDTGETQKSRTRKCRQRARARREKTAPLSQEKQTKVPGKAFEKYGAVESRKRLEKHGFHREVTRKTLDQVLAAWERTMSRDRARPTAEEYWCGSETMKTRLTRGFLLLKDKALSQDSGRSVSKAGIVANSALESILTHAHAGPLVIRLVSRNGRKTMLNLALTSRRMWETVTRHLKLWDSISGNFTNEGHPSTFIALAPEYTIADILSVRMEHPYGIYSPSKAPIHPDAWKERAIKEEGNIMRDVIALKWQFGTSETPFWNTLGALDKAVKPEGFPQVQDRVFRMIRALKPFPELAFSTGYMWQANPFIDSPGHMPFQPTILYCARRLREMMGEIYQRRAGIRVLQFHKTQLFDRRILAVILRACPNVEMVGVYDCPLIHLGDVTCLLDLIHEINLTRRSENRPRIKAFDLYPYFQRGMAYQHENAATYGLIWEAQGLDTVQRGFFQIIMEAFLKAKAMGLDLLFSKHGSFLDFLHRVPNAPFAVPGFLDALYRYIELDEKSFNFHNKKKQAMYDLLKPVRMDLERVGHDWPKWYLHEMGDYALFCSSCGYQTFQAFFSAVSRQRHPIDRACSKCIVRDGLDKEADHLKRDKRRTLTCLFRGWDPKAFNFDAPILEKGKDLMWLHSTETVRPAPPGLYVDANGDIVRRQYVVPFLRDKKIPSDSLQNLPSLWELVEGPDAEDLWKNNTFIQASNADIHSHVVRQLGWDFQDDETTSGVPHYPSTRDDRALPDHPLEVQPPRPTELGRFISLDNDAALEHWKMMREYGW